ncbi:MAG: aminotransferase class I/II-fold pyridoxal phosphate-dependent enzyme [Eubacteriales bacterium]|jgi:lysine decarboxylase|nr:aminotransferase class I/II-fold pyridoxal phosphate-dependent enzyme [Eubacteriales bacterium]
MNIKRGIEKALKNNAIRFCMPGHGGLGSLALYYDVTEIDGTDTLQNPKEIIKLAQNEAAVAFGAMQSFFLVNGSSVGLHAAIMSVCQRGDLLIVDRGCHISVINALVLNGIKPVFVEPEYNLEFGVSAGINPSSVKEAYKKHPHAKGALITSPTYYGVCSDIFEIAEIVHSFGGVLIVDEAHGAHFAFSPKLPKTALFQGADIVVQSTHKTLPCITQGAIMHIGTSRADKKCIQENLNMLHTTSPSYLIMASIEQSVEYMKNKGKQRLDFVIEQVRRLKSILNETGKFRCLDSDDKTRLVIHVGENAPVVAKKLRNLHNIIVEMCDGLNLVLIARATNEHVDFVRLERALMSIALTLPALNDAKYPPPPRGKAVLTPKKAYFSKTKSIFAKEAIGKIAARAVYKMPPCICLLSPGEMVTEEIADLINQDITVVD